MSQILDRFPWQKFREVMDSFEQVDFPLRHGTNSVPDLGREPARRGQPGNKLRRAAARSRVGLTTRRGY